MLLLLGAVLFRAGDAPIERVEQTRQQQTEDGGQVQPVRREKDTAHAQHRGQIRRDDGIVVKTDHVEFSRSKF